MVKLIIQIMKKVNLNMERLNKVIAKSGICSRRKADELIEKGLVLVNGEVVLEMGTKVSPSDQITINGVVLTKEEKKYYCLYKPRGIISSVSDELNRMTVLDILPSNLKTERIYPVGRLDYDTKGVILLTNDGDFMNALVGPKSGIEKEYLARIQGIAKKSDLIPFEKGIMLENKKTLPAIAKIVSVDKEHNSTLVNIILTQGRYHQVKEMFKAIGFEVKKLTRVRFGNITLDNLHEGEIRPLTVHEVKTLYALSKKEKVLSVKKEKGRYFQ